jgi:hypothetical protein
MSAESSKPNIYIVPKLHFVDEINKTNFSNRQIKSTEDE